MLFNSYAFIFEFLPVLLLAFFVAGAFSRPLALVVLLAGSLFFYAGWAGFPWLIVGSFTFNYAVARLMVWGRTHLAPQMARPILPAAITANLLLLVYYKYTNFLVANVDAATGAGWALPHIVLPIGISFFTFTQIAFLVDVARREVNEPDFLKYGLFVSYFPHLLAGPIIHHKDIMPQFGKASVYRFSSSNVAIGLTIFTFGLFKKVVLADSYLPSVALAFSGDHPPLLMEAWRSALAYTLQIYFDFSGYSDMAIGLSRLFGIDLPLNFNSPYKAVSIIDFWRRWHMTLSRFLRDYLYFSLGGNRKGKLRRYANLYVTMLLGGIWHGAGWTFVIWGALHGGYLMINHLWRELGGRTQGRGVRTLAQALTFLVVVVAWVFFRAPDVTTALLILKGMMGLNNPPGLGGVLAESIPTAAFAIIALGLLVVFLLPNTQEILAVFHPGMSPEDREKPPAQPGRWSIPRLTPALGIVIGIVLFLALTRMSHVTEFIYYQF